MLKIAITTLLTASLVATGTTAPASAGMKKTRVGVVKKASTHKKSLGRLAARAIPALQPVVACPAGTVLADRMAPLAACLRPGTTTFVAAESVTCPLGYGVIAGSFLGASTVPIYVCRATA